MSEREEARAVKRAGGGPRSQTAGQDGQRRTPVIDAQVEIIKLARLLGTEPEELGYLGAAEPDDIRLFRDQVTDVLFDGDRARLGGFAAGSRVIPAAFAATIAERALGPVLCARLTALVEPDKAVDIAKRLPAPFLAEVAVEMDPRRAKDVIAHVPPNLIEAVAGELSRRGEAVTMGRFVAFLMDPALRAAINGIDDATLLETGFVMEGKERLGHIVSLLPPDRLRSIIVAANEREMWPETLDLLTSVSAKRRAALVKVALDENLEGMLPGLFGAVEDTDSWETGLRLLAELPAKLKSQLAPAAQTLEAKQRKRALERARHLGLLDELGPIGEALSG
jgi:hypothetical protein